MVWALYRFQNNHWDQFGAGIVIAIGEWVNYVNIKLWAFTNFNKIIGINMTLGSLLPPETVKYM